MSATERRITNLCRKCRNLVDATRIWNWIDCQSEPEVLWAIMAKEIPWVFDNPSNVNSMKFTYAADVLEYESKLRNAKRDAREAYIHFRSICDLLDKLPADSAKVSNENIEALDKYSEELKALMNSEYWC